MHKGCPVFQTEDKEHPFGLGVMPALSHPRVHQFQGNCRPTTGYFLQKCSGLVTAICTGRCRAVPLKSCDATRLLSCTFCKTEYKKLQVLELFYNI